MTSSPLVSSTSEVATQTCPSYVEDVDPNDESAVGEQSEGDESEYGIESKKGDESSACDKSECDESEEGEESEEGNDRAEGDESEEGDDAEESHSHTEGEKPSENQASSSRLVQPHTIAANTTSLEPNLLHDMHRTLRQIEDIRRHLHEDGLKFEEDCARLNSDINAKLKALSK
jgi:hypothetical protein